MSVLQYEGTWEEILTHSQDLAGRHVRLTVVSTDERSPSLPTLFRHLDDGNDKLDRIIALLSGRPEMQ
jgi:hypothetical protein